MRPTGKTKSMSYSILIRLKSARPISKWPQILTTLQSLVKHDINCKEPLSSNKMSHGFESIYTISSCTKVHLDNLKIRLATVLKATHS